MILPTHLNNLNVSEVTTLGAPQFYENVEVLIMADLEVQLEEQELVVTLESSLPVPF